jgi:hypothetical protein
MGGAPSNRAIVESLGGWGDEVGTLGPRVVVVTGAAVVGVVAPVVVVPGPLVVVGPTLVVVVVLEVDVVSTVSSDGVLTCGSKKVMIT